MKGQSQIVSAIIIVLLTLGIIGTVFPWASSVIQKKRDAKTLDDIYNFFQKLDKVIIDVARNGGEETLIINTPGLITVYPATNNDQTLNNSIIFEFKSKVSNVAESVEWIPLNTPNTNSSAILGIDTPNVIFGKSSVGSDSIYIWYRLWLRQLNDKTAGKNYKIAIAGSTVIKKSDQGFIRVQRLGSSQNGNLITTEINIIV